MDKFFEERIKDQHANKTPFRDQLTESSVYGGLEELVHNPDKVIRTISLDVFEKIYDDVRDPIEGVHRSSLLYKELQDLYHISTPVEFVVGNDDKGVPIVYIVTDKIEGKDLHRKNFNADECKVVIPQLNMLYESWIQYLSDRYKGGGYFLNDIMKNEQYVYGKRKGDEKDHIYLVDTDAHHVSGEQKKDFYKPAYDAAWSIRDMEQRLSIEFGGARLKLQQLIDLFPEKERIKV